MNKTGTMFSALRAFRTIAVVSLLIGVLTVTLAVVAYVPAHPHRFPFSIPISVILAIRRAGRRSFLNNGTILAAPLRVMVVVFLLLVLRGYDEPAALVRGDWSLFFRFVSAFGTVCMTAVPYSTGPAVHKAGIGSVFSWGGLPTRCFGIC